MHLIFWQNYNSIHQSSFFRSIAKFKKFRVTLIIQNEISKFRNDMGWYEPSLEGVEVYYLSKNEIEYKKFLKENSNKSCIHFFSGIKVYPRFREVFEEAIKLKCRIGILSEAFDLKGVNGGKWKGVGRLLNNVIKRFQYEKYIEIILAKGDMAVQQYKKFGYPSEKILNWGYVVEPSTVNNYQSIDDDKFTIVFVGAGYYRKGFDILLKSLSLIPSEYNIKVDAYCLKNESDRMPLPMGTDEGRIEMKVFLSNSQLRENLAKYDLLLLTSRFDGWGAVISEGLTEGVPVVSSSACGASCLIKSDKLGAIFTNENASELAQRIIEQYNKGKVDVGLRSEIKEWAKESISGEAFAKYFCKIISRLENPDIETTPLPPWESKF